jgi:hypothetical protein
LRFNARVSGSRLRRRAARAVGSDVQQLLFVGRTGLEGRQDEAQDDRHKSALLHE